MAISPIGFGNTAVTSSQGFKDLVNEMPAHRRTDTSDKPLASTTLNYNNKEESHWLRNTLIGAGTLVGTAALLRTGAKEEHGWFKVANDASGPVTWVKKKLQAGGEFVDKQWNKLKNLFSSEEKAEGKKTSGDESK